MGRATLPKEGWTRPKGAAALFGSGWTPSPRGFLGGSVSVSRSAKFIDKWPVRVITESELSATRLQMSALETTNDESGLVVWSTSGEKDGGTVLAFPWITMMPGVVAIGDTMEVMTNVILIDAAGKPLPPESRLRAIFQVLWDLKWHEAVAEGLRSKKCKVAPRSGACGKSSPKQRASIRLTAAT